MQPNVPDVAQQVPAGGGVSTPPSGSYGEGAALQRLEAALPGMDPAVQQATEPAPMPPGGPTGGAAPSGLPRGLLAPTRQPNIPVSTPMDQPQLLVGQGPERRTALLEALITSPEVSVDTKQWARLVLERYRVR